MRLLASALLLAACQSDDGSPTDTDAVPDTDTDTEPAPGTQAVVRLEGLELPDSTFTGAVSVAFYWEDGPHVGSPFPATQAVDTCVPEDGTGNPAPPTTGTLPFGGVVRVALDGAAVSLSNGGADLGPWPTGQALSLSARDGDVAAFELDGLLVVPEPPSAAQAEVLVNGAIEVSWGGAPSGVVYVTLTGSYGSLRCLAVDDGLFTVDPSELVAVGAAPTVFVARSLEVVETLPGVDVTGWAFVSASAD